MGIPSLNAIRDWANKKFSLVSVTGCDLGLSIDTSTYVMTLELKNSAGQVISSKSIDFPIESMVVNASYKDGKLTLTLQNGQTLVVDISAIVGGLVNESRKIAGVDLKDDISVTELLGALGIKKVATSGSYNDLTDKPTIPTVPKNVSAFTNDAGYITEEQDPTVPAYVKAITAQNITDWNAKSTFSGSYNDLTDKPTIPTVPTDVSAFNNDVGYITDDTLVNYSLISATGCDLGLSIDTKTYEMTIELKNAGGTVLSTKSIDFPIESMVVNASYKDGKLTLTLQNGQTLEVDISAIVSGLVNDTRTIAGLDLKDDITKEELITALGIPAWAMAANKPSYTAAEVGALPSDTKIPTTVAELTDAKDYAKTTDVEALSGRMDTAESDIETLETSTAALDGRLDTAEQNIANQDTRLDRAEDTINQHSSQIAEISEEIKVEKSIVVDDYALVESGSGVLNDLVLYGRSHQDGTPTPEDPSAIRALSGVETQSKNLFNPLDVKNLNGTYGFTANRYGVVIDFVGDLTFSYKGTGNSSILYRKFNKTSATLGESSPITSSFTVSVNKDELFVMHGNSTITSANALNDLLPNAMIEEGTTASDYVPYGHTESAIPTLYGIPVAEGGNYVDKSGQHWISDVLDLEKGEIHRYCEKAISTKRSDGPTTTSFRFIFSHELKHFDSDEKEAFLCTLFSKSDYTYRYDTFDSPHYFFSSTSLIFFTDLKYKDIDLTNQYAVAEVVPYTEPIPQAVLNSIRQLRSFADSTHIYCDNGSLEAVIAENTEVGNAIGNVADKVADVQNDVADLKNISRINITNLEFIQNGGNFIISGNATSGYTYQVLFMSNGNLTYRRSQNGSDWETLFTK